MSTPIPAPDATHSHDGPGAALAAGLTLPAQTTAQVSGSVQLPAALTPDVLNSLTRVVLAALAKQTEELIHIRALLQRDAPQASAGEVISLSPGPGSAAAGSSVGPAAILRKHGRRFLLLWLNTAQSVVFQGPLGPVNYALNQGWNNLSFLDDGTPLQSGDGANFQGYALACDDIPPGLV